MKKFLSEQVRPEMTDKLERMIWRESGIAAADMGFNMRPTEFISKVTCTTEKTAKSIMENLAHAKFIDILRIVSMTNHRDGENPFYDEVIACLLEAKMKTPKA